MRTILISILLLFVTTLAFAAAGFADAHYNHQRWLFPAYAYCLVLGLLILLGLVSIFLIYKTKINNILEHISEYLIQHHVLAIVFCGILMAIPMGIIITLSWEIIWFLAILPIMGLMAIFPINLVNMRFREKFLLSPFWIKWGLLTSISSIMASVLFIILTECNLLPGTDITYFARPDSSHPEFYSPNHPYDSMKEIWDMPFIFISEIALALILYSFGIWNRIISGKLSALRHRKQKGMNDIYGINRCLPSEECGIK